MIQSLNAITDLKSQLAEARQRLLSDVCDQIKADGKFMLKSGNEDIISEKGVVCYYSPEIVAPSYWGVIVSLRWDSDLDQAVVSVLDGEKEVVVDVAPDLVVETEALQEFIERCRQE